MINHQIPIPRWLVEVRHEFLSDEKNSISFDIKYLGKCRIDVYRQPGDLHEPWHWDIKSAESGEIPDAKYGANQPEPRTDLGYFPIIKMWEVTTHYFVNGWFKKETVIYSNDGEVLAFKRY